MKLIERRIGLLFAVFLFLLVVGAARRRQEVVETVRAAI